MGNRTRVIAFTRDVSSSISRCELTHMTRAPIDFDRARTQHCAFEEALRSVGCEVRRLADLSELPDAVFVQDTAIVFDEIAIIARPGAESRRPETATVANALTNFRPLHFIESPGTLDGGDVVCAGRSVWVGQSGRTNADGIRQLKEQLTRFGYTFRGIPVTGCLHLQSAITPVADGVMLINRSWLDSREFGAIDFIEIDPSE